MRIAIIGGGINGLCSAWRLAQDGHAVSLFERDTVMSQTSSASSKLLHGGLRYLEQREFRLVREALQERQWWLQHVPRFTRRLPLLYPLYAHSRPRLLLKLGLSLYDLLAGRKGIGRHRWLTPAQVARCSPDLKQEGLLGAYLFFDGQMDDQALGLWVAEQCRTLGVDIREHTEVKAVDADGGVKVGEQWQRFERVINIAGPWSGRLLEQSSLPIDKPLDLVRGSHLLLPPVSRYGHMLEVPGETRIVFVLPWKGKTLLGTTEVRQSLEEPIACSDAERDYLLKLYNHYFCSARGEGDILQRFAGVRPLLGGGNGSSPSKTSREYQLHWRGRLLTVSGGKWTTARALAAKVAESIVDRR